MQENIIKEFIKIIIQSSGNGDKEKLINEIEDKFLLKKKGAVYYCDFFAVRFCSTKSKNESVSNTVMALKHVKMFDDVPLFVCVVGPDKNLLRLANATFIKKVSHSSRKLKEDNIVGNINYSDIRKEYNGIKNVAENYEVLFELHKKLSFEGNLSRIVNETKNIKASGKQFVPTKEQRENILEAPERSLDFIRSDAYTDLKIELDKKTIAVQSDIQLIREYYDHDVKMRGNLIEYFITSTDEKKKTDLRNKIKKREVLDDIKVLNGLGDYSTRIGGYVIETDIKSKITKLSSAPKGYNVDKFLEFLSNPASIYLLYIIAMDDEQILTELVSVFQSQILDKTKIQHHWAGRNSRGTVQFDGRSLEYFIKDDSVHIEIEKAKRFLRRLMDSEE